AVRADEPVPVRVNAAGWDGSADFTAWMANQLAIDYPLNPRVARAMVDTNRILPVLDGLDEMDPPEAAPVLASAALDRLNEPPWRNRTVVVICRTSIYAQIRQLRGDAGLFGATTITLQPFSAADIRTISSTIVTNSASPRRRGLRSLTSLFIHPMGPWQLHCAHRGCSAWPRRPYTAAVMRPPSLLRRVATPPRSATYSSGR
ncbi:MAG TPA: hypothetical protein VN306_02050, partial [Mycobacterium sp.]|nr:hypothetical protein [Mycobacterium sp.]